MKTLGSPVSEERYGGDINVGLIYGSVREGRLCDKVAEWAARRIGSDGPRGVSCKFFSGRVHHVWNNSDTRRMT